MHHTNAETCGMIILSAFTTERRCGYACLGASTYISAIDVVRECGATQSMFGTQFTRLNAIYREEQKQKKGGGASHDKHGEH